MHGSAGWAAGWRSGADRGIVRLMDCENHDRASGGRSGADSGSWVSFTPSTLGQVQGHGLLRDNAGRAVEFRFGTLNLLGAVAATWCFNPMLGEPPASEWPYRQIDGSYERALARVRSSFFSLDRAALHMDTCLGILNDPDNQLRDGMHLDDAAPWMNAHEDVHLYADLILHYLYDYSDGLAVVLCRFFTRDDLRPSDRSFYKHRTSVANGAACDKRYQRILAQHTGWFDALAAELNDPVPGLRTKLVHGHGTPSDFRSPYNQRAKELRSLVAGFFEMHDVLLAWLEDRVTSLALPGTQLRVTLDTDPPFMTFSVPSPKPSIFSHFLVPNLVEL